MKEIGDATKLQLPRCYFTSDVCAESNDTELHVFADASQKACEAAAYLVSGKQLSLTMAKSHVAPTRKQLTLSVMELMAALTAGPLVSYLQEQLQVTRFTLWSDSQIILHWLNNTKVLKLFISSRNPRSNEADINFEMEVLPHNWKPLLSAHKRDNNTLTGGFFSVEAWSYMVTKQTTVAFIASNRCSPCINH